MRMMIVTHEMKFARNVSTKVSYMDQGELYEEGSPEETFDHPRRERTRLFVKRLKVFEEIITSRDFDFIGVNTRIEEFGRSYSMEQRTIRGIETVFEELCIQTLLSKLKDVDMRVTCEYSEDTGHAQMRVFYKGGFDATAEMDALSAKIIENVSVETEYAPAGEGDYTDCIKIKLK